MTGVGQSRQRLSHLLVPVVVLEVVIEIVGGFRKCIKRKNAWPGKRASFQCWATNKGWFSNTRSGLPLRVVSHGGHTAFESPQHTLVPHSICLPVRFLDRRQSVAFRESFSCRAPGSGPGAFLSANPLFSMQALPAICCIRLFLVDLAATESSTVCDYRVRHISNPIESTALIKIGNEVDHLDCHQYLSSKVAAPPVP